MASNDIKIQPYTKSIEEWMDDMVIPTAERAQITSADVVVLPVGYRDCEQAFAESVYDFLVYASEYASLNIAVCCTEDGFTKLELCSAKTRLGKFFLASSISGTIFWNVISCFVYDQVKPLMPQMTHIESTDTPRYLVGPEVSFSIVIPDSHGHKQEITYDGPVEGIDKVGDIIKNLTNDRPESNTCSAQK